MATIAVALGLFPLLPSASPSEAALISGQSTSFRSDRQIDLGHSVAPIDVTLSVDGNGSVMQGEPLVLRALISDIASATTNVHYALREDDWLQISLEDEKGKQSVPVLDTMNYPYILHTYGNHSGDRVDPNRTQNEVRVLRPEWLGDPVPGNYCLRIRVQLPYSRGSDYEAMEKGTSPVFIKEIVLPLKITSVKRVALRAKAAALREILLAEPRNASRELAAEILYAIPDEYADAERQGMLRDRRADSEVTGFNYIYAIQMPSLNRPEVVAERRRKLLEFRKAAAESLP